MSAINSTFATKNGKNVQKDIDNIEVEIKSCKNIFLRGNGVLVLSTNHELRVVDEVQRKQHGPAGGVDHVYCLSGNKESYEPEDDEYDERSVESPSEHREVHFGLERKQCEGKADTCTHPDRHDHLQTTQYILMEFKNLYGKECIEVRITQKMGNLLPKNEESSGGKAHRNLIELFQ